VHEQLKALLLCLRFQKALHVWVVHGAVSIYRCLLDKDNSQIRVHLSLQHKNTSPQIDYLIIEFSILLVVELG